MHLSPDPYFHLVSPREKFVSHLDQNFSVQAAAGTGKTTALVDRVAHAAQHHPATLGQFVVVTYTNRAADEMRQRLRERLLSLPGAAQEQNPAPGLSRLFIGTIHSFCLRLIQQYALPLGYAAEVQSWPENDGEIFRQFRRQQNTAVAPASELALLHRVVPARDLTELSQQLTRYTVDWSDFIAKNQEVINLAMLRLSEKTLDGWASKNASATQSIARWQREWQQFSHRWNQPDGTFVEPPPYDGKGGKEFASAWASALAGWSEPILRAALGQAAREAAAFQEYRLRQGKLFFSDQIVLAHRLLRDSAIRQRLLRRAHRILLDEAQDTDPLQFELLVELARPPESAAFTWPGSGLEPRAGHFVMVGDQQQAIYRDRATLELYQCYHDALVQTAHGSALTFAETFRCRPGVVDFVNDRFSHVLTGQAGQAAFVPLTPGHRDFAGQTVRWSPPAVIGNSATRLAGEAAWIARQLRQRQPAGLHARHWGEVALLCPARQWLVALREALRAEKIPCALQFDQTNAQRPEYLWLTALLTIHAEPNNEFEIIGVLRELYGISDELIFQRRWADGPDTPRSFTLAPYAEPRDEIERQLGHWHACRSETLKLPLAEAVHLWCARTELAARLAALPQGGTAVDGLAALFLRAQEAQGQGKSLADWARELRDGLPVSSAEISDPREQRVQLMTIKKSKGLQWDAVILPFLGRVNREGGRAEYPRVACPVGLGAANPAVRGAEKLEVVLQRGFLSGGWTEREGVDSAQSVEERRRLYYVACTRARHTLILVDDALVWNQAHDGNGLKLKSPNGYEALTGQAEMKNDQFVHAINLSAACVSPELVFHPDVPKESMTPSSVSADAWPAPIDEFFLPKPVKSSPSRSAKKTPRTVDEMRRDSLLPQRAWLQIAPNEALLYGVWWHELMRVWPWAAAEKTQRECLDAALPGLKAQEQKSRAEHEVQLLQHSALAQDLAPLSSSQLLREVPYARALAGGEIEEGRLDLLYRQSDGSWLLLDWKTDEVPNERSAWPKLQLAYQSQLSAYANMVQKMGWKVSGKYLYSTVLGEATAVD